MLSTLIDLLAARSGRINEMARSRNCNQIQCWLTYRSYKSVSSEGHLSVASGNKMKAKGLQKLLSCNAATYLSYFEAFRSFSISAPSDQFQIRGCDGIARCVKSNAGMRMALNVTGCQFWSECGRSKFRNPACLEGKSGQMIAGVSFIALHCDLRTVTNDKCSCLCKTPTVLWTSSLRHAHRLHAAWVFARSMYWRNLRKASCSLWASYSATQRASLCVSYVDWFWFMCALLASCSPGSFWTPPIQHLTRLQWRPYLQIAKSQRLRNLP